MKYEKPEVLLSGNALTAIQSQGKSESESDGSTDYSVTVGAYDSDE